MVEGDVSTGREEGAWRVWIQKTLSEFLNVHFAITLLVLLFWIYAIGGPLESLSTVIEGLSAAPIDKLETRLDAIDRVVAAVTSLSGVFTTVVGLVLGHYFGQRGQERARVAAEERSESAFESLDETTDETTEVIEEQAEQLDRTQSALSVAIRMLDGSEEPDLETVARLLGVEIGEFDADELHVEEIASEDVGDEGSSVTE